MIALIPLLLFLSHAPLPGLDQIRADTNPEHRAKAAVEFALQAERNAEAAYSKAEMEAVRAELKAMQTAIELARDSFLESGRSPQRHAGPYKWAELRTQEMLIRLDDLERRMDSDERSVVAVPKIKVQEIHDGWFDGIMGKKR